MNSDRLLPPFNADGFVPFEASNYCHAWGAGTLPPDYTPNWRN